MDSVEVAVVVMASPTATGGGVGSRARSAQIGGKDGDESCYPSQTVEEEDQGVECNAMQTAAVREPS